MCKAPLKSSPPINTQLFAGQMPFRSPNQQCQSTEGNSRLLFIALNTVSQTEPVNHCSDGLDGVDGVRNPGKNGDMMLSLDAVLI